MTAITVINANECAFRTFQKCFLLADNQTKQQKSNSDSNLFAK